MSEAPPDFDRAAVMARLRAGDPAELERAYSRVFGTDEGRLVLADILAQAGVGQRFGGKSLAVEIAYHQGGHDVAVEIMGRAGFDPASAALMVMTGLLEGQPHEREFGPQSAEPEPITD